MDIDITIKNGLSTAFRLLTGLKKEVIFKRKTLASSYDFNLRQIEANPVEETIVEVVVIKNEKVNSPKRNTRKIQLLYRTDEVGELSNFDMVEVEGSDWQIGQAPLSSTGHISYVEVYQEVNRG